MATKRTPAEWLEIDHYVRAFEGAQRGLPTTNLYEYLPPCEHPLYRAILQELMRVDLEYQSYLGASKTLDDYRQQFPDFFLDREAVREVAFEEYRQRLARGEYPLPAEYEERYGVDTSRWPSVSSSSQFPVRSSV